MLTSMAVSTLEVKTGVLFTDEFLHQCVFSIIARIIMILVCGFKGAAIKSVMGRVAEAS